MLRANLWEGVRATAVSRLVWGGLSTASAGARPSAPLVPRVRNERQRHDVAQAALGVQRGANRHEARGMTACGAVFGTGSRLGSCGGSRGKYERPAPAGRPLTLASKVRGAKFTKPKASRRGGLAARDSVRQASGHQAGSKSPSLASRFENHPSRDAESHDSASREITVKKSSSRWADRPAPVLQVEFPNPWRIRRKI